MWWRWWNPLTVRLLWHLGTPAHPYPIPRHQQLATGAGAVIVHSKARWAALTALFVAMLDTAPLAVFKRRLLKNGLSSLERDSQWPWQLRSPQHKPSTQKAANPVKTNTQCQPSPRMCIAQLVWKWCMVWCAMHGVPLKMLLSSDGQVTTIERAWLKKKNHSTTSKSSDLSLSFLTSLCSLCS